MQSKVSQGTLHDNIPDLYQFVTSIDVVPEESKPKDLSSEEISELFLQKRFNSRVSDSQLNFISMNHALFTNPSFEYLTCPLNENSVKSLTHIVCVQSDESLDIVKEGFELISPKDQEECLFSSETKNSIFTIFD